MSERGLVLRLTEPGWAQRAFKTLLPGGHAAVSGGHGIALEAEDVGFEVRDCIVCLGMPSRRIWLLRKPLQEGTVAGQMLSTGTGAINIDACRVGTGSDKGIWPITDRSEQRNSMADSMRASETITTIGRWPPNLVFVHGPECRDVGTKRVRASRLHQVIERSKNLSTSIGRQTDSFVSGYADKDGLETVTAWTCQPGCPVELLDQQSGERRSAGLFPAKGTQPRTPGQCFIGVHQGTLYEDSGGASRFFPQFRDETELDGWLMKLIGG